MDPNDDVLSGRHMQSAEIDRLFESVGFGVLSLTRAGRPYGLPMSFGFDGEDRLYFGFVGHSDQGRKISYAEDSDWASFLAYDITSPADWRSAIAEGTIDRVRQHGWDAAREAMADNAFKPDLLSSVDRQRDPRVWVLEIEERAGRQVG
jgi:nitroimidazol reductase NimA-like FMN-containing flavoprotein (pyridoxamine 5'-phosphate oxidase superfamily)